ncbi:MAG: cell division protein ZapA [Rhodobacteraceae bacterium]|jgi:cell division protein ZapA|nr:cell division protein ZapA [Paracoccaceae bacterium]
MPELTVEVGGRPFTVACQEGEEEFLRAAAALLDAEATTLVAQIGRMPEARMLLMAGLMLADKTAALEDQLRGLRGVLEVRDAELAQLRARPAQRVEVPVMPVGLSERMAELAARAESLAARIEERGGA